MGNKRKYRGTGKLPSIKKRRTGKDLTIRKEKSTECHKLHVDATGNVPDVNFMGPDESPQTSNTDCTKPISQKAAFVERDDSIELTIESERPAKTGLELAGRRIVHLEYFLGQLKKFASHSRKFGCSLDNMICESEKRIGLLSKFSFTCNFCGYRQLITTDPKQIDVLDINKSTVSGIMSIGAGYSGLNQFLAAIDVPAISDKLYNKVHKDISENWQETAAESMAEAAAREREAALIEGRVNERGIPVIDVVADGCWAKRSYRSNYSSLSGAAAIIGKKYGQVIFLAVRNKYCSICDYIKRSNKSIPHNCYKNFDGAASAMEADILVEGFKKSIIMYGLIYGRLISDGDSSTYTKILEARPYPDFTVEKIECTNHILRNFCNKMRALTTDTRYPIKLRKLVTPQRIMSMRRNIKKAVLYYKNSEASISQKINDLHCHINNILLHVFHSHSCCKDFYCSEVKLVDNEFINQIRGSGLWLRMTLIMSAIAAHARSLIQDMHSNIVESFNGTIAKFIGGKRINYATRDSYQARCFAAALSFNTKTPIYTLQKHILNRSPKSRIHKHEKAQLSRLMLNKKYKRVKKRLFRQKCDKQSDYGQYAQKPDMDSESFERNKALLMENLKQNCDIRDQIQKETVLQRDATKWLELRRKMLTASNFGSVILRRRTISISPLVKSLLSEKSLANVPSIRHGVSNEKVAIQQLETQENITIKPCGLFIDEEHPFLGATPDGVTEDGDSIVEVKCPITAFKLGLKTAVEQKKVRFWTLNNGSYNINKRHPWYYQIQGQLHITKKHICILGVWSGDEEPIKVEYIRRDDEFWEAMKPKLVSFYTECLLPEIIDSRLKRGMPVREPLDIASVLEKKQKIKGTKIENKENKLPKVEEDKKGKGRGKKTQSVITDTDPYIDMTKKHRLDINDVLTDRNDNGPEETFVRTETSENSDYRKENERVLSFSEM